MVILTSAKIKFNVPPSNSAKNPSGRPHRLRIFSSLLIAGSLLTGGGVAGELKSKETSVAGGPLITEATTQFRTMKTTVYQHRTQVDRSKGIFCYDCVGFVSYALRKATPVAWGSAVKATGIAKGRIPSPLKYRAFFASLAGNPQPGWEAVTKVSALQAGDVVAWEHKTKTSVGHAVIIAGVPVRRTDGSWQVEVYDSTSTPHSDDSRPNDERAQALDATGQHSGLGHGFMVLIADPDSGALVGLRWSLKARAMTVPISAARPTS